MKNRAGRVVLCLLAMGVALSQPSPQDGTPTCNPELLNRSGWRIPGLYNATTKTSGARLQTDGVPNDIMVDILKPRVSSGVVTLVKCVNGQSGRFEVRNQRVRVIELLRFKKHGHVFAYRANLGLEGPNGQAIGSAEVLLFYDPDGSGRFTVQRDVAGARPFIVIPDWVKSL
jgi:hypothetical protein